MLYQFLTSDVGSELSGLGNNTMGPYKWNSATSLLGTIMTWGLLLATIFAFVCIVWSGVQWQMSWGDKAKVQQARDRLIHCLIGLALLAVSYAIVLVIQYFLGLNIFQSS